VPSDKIVYINLYKISLKEYKIILKYKINNKPIYNKNDYSNLLLFYYFIIMMEVNKSNIPVPFHTIQKLFRIPILKIKNLSKNIPNYYNVITAYGNMCLII
jgi:hypothetical protein